MKKILTITILALISIFLFAQSLTFSNRESALRKEHEEIQEKLENAINTRDQLKAQINEYDRPESIEKAAREKLNYRRPDEKMIIIIPSNENKTSTTN